ncbi:9887_t:CDS:2, partial [Acaulospora morrowiae]
TQRDENFDSLSSLDNHIASFTVNLEDGLLLDATPDITQTHATAAYKLLQNVNLLLTKQQENTNSYDTDANKDVKEDENRTTTINRVSVAFQDCGYGFTVADEKIYAIKYGIKSETEQPTEDS